MELIISELMTKSVISVGTNEGLLGAIQKMRDERLSCIAVTEKGTPVGIITERDIVRTLAAIMEGSTGSQGLTVADVMSSPAITIQHDASLFEALVISRTRKIRHLPVVSTSGDLVGMITHSDLARTHFDILDRHTEALETSVLERTAELAKANEQLLALSLTDTLLGIGNRRAMEVDLQHTLHGAIRYQRPCSLAILDVDYFKRYNDHYGHQAGDDALKAVTDHVKNAIRGADRLYRYGGEEFLLLLPETDMNYASQVVTRIIISLAEKKIPHEESPLSVLTVSAGVTGIPAPCETPIEYPKLIKDADRNLYTAKDTGRNRAIAA